MGMLWVWRVSLSEQLLTEILVEFPQFRVVSKSRDRLSTLIDWLLRRITFGLQNRYLTEYHTVIGETLYVAPSWTNLDDRARYVLLCHERVHLRQRKRYGTVGMAFLYLLPIFPLGLAIGRARIEWEAYEETLRATMQAYGARALELPELRTQIIMRFTGPDYGWMWPFPRTIARWYDRKVAELKAEPTPRFAQAFAGSEGKSEES
jgi:hypothetical protein